MPIKSNEVVLFQITLKKFVENEINSLKLEQVWTNPKKYKYNWSNWNELETI